MAKPLRIHKGQHVVGDVTVETSIAVPTPELDKMAAVKDESQAIGAFLDAMPYSLCEADDEGRYWPVQKSIEQVLAEHFNIDLRKVENERRSILEAIRR